MNTRRSLLVIALALAFGISLTARGGPPTASTTHHTGLFNGQQVRYTATVADTIVPGADGKPAGSMVTTTYLREDVTDRRSRPVLFAFNGGPGASSTPLHLSAFGPRRYVTSADGDREMGDNPYSPLDALDLVFIDPIGTGFSRPLPGVDGQYFWSVEGDAASVKAFIKTWLKENGRESSPRFLCGESYGTARAAQIVSSGDDLEFDGVLLLSMTADLGDKDLERALLLPTFAATAAFHGKGQLPVRPVGEIFDEAERFALGDYLAALKRGDTLPASEKARIAGEVARRIGLSAAFVQEKNLRIDRQDYMLNLLKDAGLRTGQIDARVTGRLEDHADKKPPYDDPSMFSAASTRKPSKPTAHIYFTDELKFETKEQYNPLNLEINAKWVFKDAKAMADPPGTVAEVMKRQPSLRLFWVGGYYDITTPLGAGKYILNRAGVPGDRLTVAAFPTGHMPYEGDQNLARFVAAVKQFVAGGTAGMDADFATSVKTWTTRPEFLSPFVDHLPVSATVPSPKVVLGHHIGAPDVLDYSEQIYGYFRKLAEASPRVKVESIGKSEEGRDILVAFISSEENIRNLETLRTHLQRLGDPRELPETEAQTVLAAAKPFYHITGGVHAPETGSSETLTELAYRLTVEDTPLIRGIREHLVVVLTPIFDPDGRDRYTDWYYRFNAGVAKEQERVAGPPYWSKYVLHDDNRDIMATGLSQRAHLAFYLKWHPTVVHDIHETLPYLYIYSGFSVRDAGVDPELYGETYWFSNYQKMRLTGFGMPGVWDHGTWDIWWPGYAYAIAPNHNSLPQMYETFSNNGPSTMLRNIVPPKPKPGEALPWFLTDYTVRDWRRPMPAYPETLWSARNTTNYTETGLLAALELAATNPTPILESFYNRSRASVLEGVRKAPFAFVLPRDQSDLTRVAFVVNYLRLQGIEVGEASAPLVVNGESYPAGSFVVKLNQPYGRFARTLLERQVYQGDSKKLDDTAWTLGLMAHARVVPVSDPAILDVPVKPVATFEPKGVLPTTPGRFYAVLDSGSNNLPVLRYLLGRTAVSIAEQPFDGGGRTIPAGSLIVPSTARAMLEPAVMRLGLQAVALPHAPAAKVHDGSLPRLAVYSTWGATQDVGWVRLALDQAGAPYDLIFKEQVKQGNLHARYDVIVIPSQGSVKDIVDGIPMTGTRPVPYMKTDRFTTLGDYGSSPDIRGGLGEDGLRELHLFVEQGGTLVTLGTASELPVANGWVPGVTVAKPSASFRAIGPIVAASVEAASNPLFFGYSERTLAVRWAASLLYSVEAGAKTDVLLRFTGTNEALLSGEFLGIQETAGRPAVFRGQIGQGQIVVFATNPMFRHQNVGEYRLLYNTILNWRYLAGPAPTR